MTKLGYEISTNFGHWIQVCLIKQPYIIEIQLLVQLLPNPEKIKYSFSQKLEKIYANEGNHSTVSCTIKVILPPFKYLQDFLQAPSASVVQASILRVHVLFYSISSLWHIFSAFHFLALRTFHNFLFNVFCLNCLLPNRSIKNIISWDNSHINIILSDMEQSYNKLIKQRKGKHWRIDEKMGEVKESREELFEIPSSLLL